MVESRLRLYSDDLGRIEAIQPPLDEQEAIVRFLDYASGRMERAIRGKKKLIALLNEQKQAIIHRAVTRGLDPNVPLKPSGIPWLGDIPKHWKVCRMKYLLREIDSRSTTGQEKLLRVSQYTGVTARDPGGNYGKDYTRAKSLINYKRATPEDLVINIMLAWNGSLGVSRHDGIVSPAYCVYRFRPNLHPWFFHHLLRSPIYRGRIKVASTGVIESRLRLYSDELGRIETLLPKFEEQQQISQYIESETCDFDVAIVCAEREIELLREYRTRLVTDVVTGKLDARAVARDLPAHVDEPVSSVSDESEELIEEEQLA